MTGTGTPQKLWGAVPPPQPHEWRAPPSARQRVRQALATPLAIGVGLFLLAIVVAITFVALQPHTPELPELPERAIGEPATEAGSVPGAPTESVGLLPDATADTPTLLVHVVGEVRRPGVVELDPNARVSDAIAAAGGATDTAALEGVNLARPVADGEQILVPNAEQLSSGLHGTEASPFGSTAQADDGRVNLNTADATALQTLPGVGPALARRILDWRQSNGAFVSVDQLIEVSGIGSKTLDALRDLVRV